MTIRVRRGSGNVFRDLGFDPEEAAHLALRSQLMIELRTRLAAVGASQAELAEALGVSQPRVSDLFRGKIDRFSVDTLVKLLGMAGADVSLVVRERGRAA
ncbi:MAG: helix-turn-helix transcriptional regulator, partial [Gemmatimonadaceae bacterium]